MPPRHTDALLRGAFRPAEALCALRASIRHRDPLRRDRSAPVQPRQHALHRMHVPLTNVLSDITGVPGLQSIRALGQGERAPHTLAASRHEHGAQSAEDRAKACTGPYRPQPLVARQQALEGHDVDHQPLTACDQARAPQDAAFNPQVDRTDHP